MNHNNGTIFYLGLNVVRVCKQWQLPCPRWLKSNCHTLTTHCVVTVASLLSTRLTRHTAVSGGKLSTLGPVKSLDISDKLILLKRNLSLWKSHRQNYKNKLIICFWSIRDEPEFIKFTTPIDNNRTKMMYKK